MIKLICKLRGFAQNQSGATAIEYGLIAAGIAIVVVLALATLSPALRAVFDQITAGLGG